ncbi:ABC transporter permease [Desertibacillus haloalkaliphilus]|uniref:ABC transporter permease n=1 Tax=Desertibacillus haloalkaliphilus TaxID=1328930 RepID=UPI001C2710D4|nr:ABC transporter permease [Desertibacillus haloalkaliphilus]MBU8907538.1 ABC transporter permease [Desertibacillus haloalkaliphilus]
MNQWMTLFKKELLEMWRNYKWLWVPIVFIILGMTDPLTSYFMPQILEAVGNLPEGAVFEMPTPSGREALLMSMGQLNMIGVLVIVLASMGLIASERKSGLAAMILVKPVSYVSYVTAKWAALVLLGVGSIFVGFLSGWYYSSLLFDPISFQLFFYSFLILAYWLIFILTITVFFNTVFLLPGVVAFTTLVTIILLSTVTNTFEQWMRWSPAYLTESIGSLLMEGGIQDNFWITALVTAVFIVILLSGAVAVLRNKQLAK